MRDDLSHALEQGTIDPGGLNGIQRILLTTDGTVTDILEAYLREPMDVVTLAQSIVDAAEAVPDLDVDRGQEIMLREVLLRGRRSGHTVLHATTIIVPDRLSPRLKAGLLERKEPIGRLLLADKAETYREIKRCARRVANGLAQHFHVFESAPFLSRTYVISHNGRGIMCITESFPEYGM